MVWPLDKGQVTFPLYIWTVIHPRADFTTKLNGHFFISANYRLLIPTTAHDMIDDIRDVFKYVSEHLALDPVGNTKFSVDPFKLAVGGESFGGYMARLAGIHVDPKPKALVSMYGMGGDLLSRFYLDGIVTSEKMPFGSPLFDLSNPRFQTIYELSKVETSTKAGFDENHRPLGGDRQGLYPLTIQRGKYLDYLTGIKGLSQTLEEEKIWSATEASQLQQVPKVAHNVIPQLLLSSDFPPIYLIHGTADSVVSIDESEATDKQLRILGVETHFVAYEGGEHGFDNAAGTKAQQGDPIYEKLKPLKEWLRAKLE
ncbi:alpha/beta-hydrolase [Sistotremastrum niveocremeum HHB9708]|uniref:Alpha/beta-hydrolase n=1 Tax=Sistotremastrum niveocremeum HHB9708 TaxID=1314777 RepID=A0A164WW89_9AGAM|nr:alpha/beta-hydrolase [Sistotremastrum niveocremeum HHB9708]